eukprot:TRINITY_DN15964_c0_g1_i1.p1 TRINITY_DN15964_c0_g1~~TRINITY_DN15964_c0_g1_i1.p1  ORF type:complete len:320 (+),score=42.70 TRINITY_DN15964_c0_g1_i1:69-962(+)
MTAAGSVSSASNDNDPPASSIVKSVSKLSALSGNEATTLSHHSISQKSNSVRSMKSSIDDGSIVSAATSISASQAPPSTAPGKGASSGCGSVASTLTHSEKVTKGGSVVSSTRVTSSKLSHVSKQSDQSKQSKHSTSKPMIIPIIESDDSIQDKTELDVIAFGEQLLNSWQDRDTQLKEVLNVPIRKSKPETPKVMSLKDSWIPGKSTIVGKDTVANGRGSRFYSRTRKLMSPWPDQEDSQVTKHTNSDSDSDNNTSIELLSNDHNNDSSKGIHWSDTVKVPSPMRKERKKPLRGGP